jgi:2'-5' RNA ligase
MKIKNYKQFIIEKINGYDYGCVMIDVPVKNWNEIISWIDTDDLYEVEGENYGIQERPHLTLLYPVLKNVKFDVVKNVLKSILNKEILIEIEDIDLFENEKFDVVKFNVKNNEYLNKAHNDLKNNIPNEDKYDIYKPHITIAYVKKGMGEKYKKYYKHSISLNKITYINSNGKNEYYFIV